MRSKRAREVTDLSKEQRRRILVVDDEPQITRVLRTSLSSHGYEIRVANDGDAALDVVSDWSPELIITDLSMPNMTGIELTREYAKSRRSRSSCFRSVVKNAQRFRRSTPAPMTT